MPKTTAVCVRSAGRGGGGGGIKGVHADETNRPKIFVKKKQERRRRRRHTMQ